MSESWYVDILQAVEVPGYESLGRILREAYNQAAQGKGYERHADQGQSFEEQPIFTISELLGSGHGLAFQAIKKIHESDRLEPEAAKRELLGAIVYLAALCLRVERGE